MDNKEARRNIIFEKVKIFFEKEEIKKADLLDIGCGDNFFKEKFNSLGINWIGMDIKSSAGSTILIKGSMENIPIHNNIFDIIFCCHTFEHTVNPLQTLREFKRVLKPCGLLILVVPYPCERQNFTTDKNHYFVFNEIQLVNLLQKNNYGIKDISVLKDTENNELDWSIFIAALNF